MKVLLNLGLSRAIPLFVEVGVDAALEMLVPAVIDASEGLVVVSATAFLTMPTLVKASPFNSTTDPDPPTAG